MEKVRIETAQNVLLEYPLANVGERILAHLLDYMLFVAYFILIYVIIIQVYSSSALFFFLFIPYFLYDFACEIIMNGQTFGKWIMKIKVVQLDGSQPTVGSYFMRWVFRLLDTISFSGIVAIITISINGKGQRLGDIAAGTTVVNMRFDAVLEDTILVEVPVNHQIMFPQVQQLTDKHANTIKDILVALDKGYVDKTHEMAERAKETLENKLNIISELPPKQFLQTLLRDYNLMHQ